MTVGVAGLAFSAAVGWSSPSTSPAEDELPPTRAELEPGRFRLRTGSFEIGVVWRAEGGFYNPCEIDPLCGVGLRVGFDVELGTRAVRMVVGGHTAPLPYFISNLAMIEIGALFGGPRVRAGLTRRFALSLSNSARIDSAGSIPSRTLTRPISKGSKHFPCSMNA